jgi:hypothetical protein
MKKGICHTCGLKYGTCIVLGYFKMFRAQCDWCNKKAVCYAPEKYGLQFAFISPPKIHEATSKKRAKPNIRKKLEALCDDLWSVAVRFRDRECIYCGATDKKLNAHHIFSRRFHSTRWVLENGVSLDVHHHTFSFDFSAHKTQELFKTFIISRMGQAEYERLRLVSQRSVKYSLGDLESIRDNLISTIKSELLDHPELAEALPRRLALWFR